MKVFFTCGSFPAVEVFIHVPSHRESSLERRCEELTDTITDTDLKDRYTNLLTNFGLL